MRINVFVGIDAHTDYVGNHLVSDPRVSSPAIVSFNANPDQSRIAPGYLEAIARVGLTDDLLNLMFVKQSRECNISTRVIRNSSTFDTFLSGAKSGTRFWFVRPINIEKFVDDLMEFYEPVAHDKLICLTYTFGINEFNRERIISRASLYAKMLDTLATDNLASPWKQFNFADYYEDGVNKYIDYEYRLFVKE